MFYFSSYYIPAREFSNIEDVFQYIDPKCFFLVFDANVIIYLRDFYLDPKQFVVKYKKAGIYENIKQLISKIQQYDLEVNPSLGIDETSRLKSNFQIDEEKRQVTTNIVTYLTYLSTQEWDKFIERKAPETLKTSGDSYPENSLAPYLNTLEDEDHMLLVAYLLSLKFVLIYHDFMHGNLSPMDAMSELCRFMREDVNCLMAIIKIIALHAFGGDTSFNKIILPTTNQSNTKKLHDIFKDAIDLCYPTIMHHVARYISYACTGNITSIYPVFVSADKRLSKLYSLCQLRAMTDNQAPINYCAEIQRYEFNDKLSWTQSDLEAIDKMYPPDCSNLGFDNQPRMMSHLTPLILECEQKLKDIWGADYTNCSK